MGYEVVKINDNTWRIEDGGIVRFFLLTGEKEALMIDSGMQIKNAREIAGELTDLPIKLILTHADMDHVASNGEFETFYMHPAEASNYYSSHDKGDHFTPVEDGEIIDLGGRELEIILTPGHTPGSIAILDVDARVLYGGDGIQDGQIFMFGVQREIHAYMASLKKLACFRDEFDEIYPSHGTIPVKPELIDQLYEAADGILRGEREYEDFEMFGNKIKRYDVGVATFLMD